MKKISDLLDSKLAKEAREYTTLASAWRCAVGDTVAAAAMPIKIEGSNLLVGVNDQMWLSELTYMKDEILERLAEQKLNVEDIRFIFKKAPPKKTKPVFRPREITEKELRTVHNVCSIIKDDELRASAERALKAYFGKYSYEDFIRR